MRRQFCNDVDITCDAESPTINHLCPRRMRKGPAFKCVNHSEVKSLRISSDTGGNRFVDAGMIRLTVWIYTMN